MKKLDLNENFISRIWENPIYYDNLKTIENEKIEVIDYGKRNKDSGADFKDATVKVGNTILNGDIEIHRAIKDWQLHHHHTDKNYDSVILNVTMWEDGLDNYKMKVPTLILSNFLTQSIHKIWREIIDNPSPQFKLPCYPDNQMIDKANKYSFIEKLGNQRLFFHIDRLKARLSSLSENSFIWDKLIFEYICEALGFAKNKSQFLSLADKVDFDYAINLSGEDQFEAYLFGLAGFLEDETITDGHYILLRSLWKNISAQINVSPMKLHNWVFFRLRPQNFPTRRIAFASVLLNKLLKENFLSKIIDVSNKGKEMEKSFIALFNSFETSDFWKSHFTFAKVSSAGNNNLGKERINDIIINVIFPFLFLYFSFQKNTLMTDKILDEYSALKRSSLNEVTRAMQQQLDIQLKSAIQSQGTIHLHNFYCMKGKCNNCDMGSYLFVKDKKQDYLKIILY